jgi:hypothetical protein
MKILSILATSLVLVMTAVSAQCEVGDTLWTHFYGGFNNDCVTAIDRTADGGFIIAGWTTSFGNGSSDFYLIRVDASGETLWTRTYGGQDDDAALSARVTRGGGIIMAGWTKSYGIGGTDIYLVKTDSNGNQLWDHTYGGTLDDTARCIRQTTDGGYIICGSTCSFGSDSGAFDIYVIKTDSSGDTAWTYTYGGILNDGASGICQTTDSNFVLTGWTATPDGNHNIYIEKIDQSGQSMWYWGYAAGIDCQGNSIVETPDGNAVIAGYTFDPQMALQCYLAEIGPYGIPQWSQNYGGSHHELGYYVSKTNDNGFIIAGSRWISFFPDTTRFYLVKTDSAGNPQWDRAYGFGLMDEGACVTPTADGHYLFAGNSNLIGIGTYDICLVKVKGSAMLIDDDISEMPKSFSIDGNYPNPFNNQTLIKYDMSADGDVKLEIFNVLGQRMTTLVDGYQKAGTHQVNWNASGCRSGIYFCKAQTGRSIETIRMLLLK